MSRKTLEPILDEITVMFSCETCSEHFEFIDELQDHKSKHSITPRREVQDDVLHGIVTTFKRNFSQIPSDEDDNESRRKFQRRPDAVAQHPQVILNNTAESRRCSPIHPRPWFPESWETHPKMSIPSVGSTDDCWSHRALLYAPPTDVPLNTYAQTLTSGPGYTQTAANMPKIRLPPIISGRSSQRIRLPSLHEIFQDTAVVALRAHYEKMEGGSGRTRQEAGGAAAGLRTEASPAESRGASR